MVPVYISWGPCQHSKSMKCCSWLAPLNSVAYIKQNLTCFLTAGDGYFLLQILSTLLRTVWPKWKNRKNLKTTTLRHPDSFLYLSFFKVWVICMGYSQTGFCHFLARVFIIHAQKQQPPCLNVPLQVNVQLTLKPGAFQRMLHYSQRCFVIAFHFYAVLPRLLFQNP